MARQTPDLEDCPIRYVVTYRPGQLAHARQGRHTYATAAQAHAWIVAALANNGGDQLRTAYGDSYRLRVEAWYCWPGHFDPRQPAQARPIPRPFIVRKGVAYFSELLSARGVAQALEPVPSAVLGPMVRVMSFARTGLYHPGGYAVQFHPGGSYWGPAEMTHRPCPYCPGTGKGEP